MINKNLEKPITRIKNEKKDTMSNIIVSLLKSLGNIDIDLETSKGNKLKIKRRKENNSHE